MFRKIKILELASVLAGPSVGQFFAELGAEVIKVENPKTGGDVTRSWLFDGEEVEQGVSSYFSALNWGKKSIQLDITSVDGFKVLKKLVQRADIMITSFKPGDDQKLGVDYQSIQKINKDIIYGHITGYGQDDLRVGYDAVIQAESGFMSINGEKDGDPLKMPVALVDVLAAHHMKEGLLLALIKKMNNGEGSYVRVSLMDAAISSLVNQGANWLNGGKVPQRTGNEHPNIAPYGDLFKTADGEQIILAVGTDKQFAALSELLEIPLSNQPEFFTNALRVKHRADLNKKLSEAIGQFESGVIVSLLSKSKIPVALIRTVDQVLDSGNPEWFNQHDKVKGVRSFMGLPEGIEPAQLGPPPKLGEHTEEILATLS